MYRLALKTQAHPFLGEIFSCPHGPGEMKTCVYTRVDLDEHVYFRNEDNSP